MVLKISIFSSIFYSYLTTMEDYSRINNILLRPDSTFLQFQREMMALRIEKETYLNLFLTTLAAHRSHATDFNRYVHLLLNFKTITGKKSADINYVGYKDRTSVLMHACRNGSKENIQILIAVPGVNLRAADPTGRNALFYAVTNANETHSITIMGLLLDAEPSLIEATTEDNSNVLIDAIKTKRIPIVQALLRRGSDPNKQRSDTGQTVSHLILKTYHENKEQNIKLLLLLLRHKANFHLIDKEGRSVFQAALQVGLDLSECADRCLQWESCSMAEPDEEDKESLTTLNQMTKQGDNASEMEEIQSNICSQRVNFSQVDFQEEAQDPLKSADGHSVKNQHNFSDNDSCEEKQEEQAKKGVDYQLLSKEIVEFGVGCQERQRNVWICIQSFLASLQKLASKHGLVIEVVGSFATGLWSNFSDIDINLIPMQNQYRNFEVILEKIYKALRSKRTELEIAEIYFNKNKVNTIKLGLNQKYNFLLVDIAIFYRNNQNRTYVAYILESLSTYPQLKPLFLIFKKLTQTYQLHDHLTGGLKTYTLFLMVFSIVKNLTTQNIGELFSQIALYYGFYYEYEFEMGQCCCEEVELFPKAVFNFIDPLNPKNNVGGKNTRVREVQNMFRSLYLALGHLEETPYLPQLLDLHSIF